MRMKKKKNRDLRMERCKDLLVAPPFPRGAWQEYFQNTRPVHLEIGCGKGGFIVSLAEKNPQINYIAVEKCADVLVNALETAKEMKLQNLRFICGDATILEEIFRPGECARLYLNFSDPWPKSRHAKRRLTYRTFLEKYRALLSPIHGELHFKTDNRGLFEFSLNEFCNAGLGLRNITLDLHNSKFEGNVMTEYEALFSSKGMPIYRCEVLF